MAHLKKVTMKSTTSLSINERFTYLRRSNAAEQATTVQRLRETNTLQQQASAKNRRLAQQMERRPAVMAALKIKKKTIRQRLGQQADAAAGRLPVRDRLAFTVPGVRPMFRGGRGRGRISVRGSRGFNNGGRLLLNRLGVRTPAQAINVLRSQRPVLRGRANSRGRASLVVGLRGRGNITPRRLRGAGIRGHNNNIAVRGQYRAQVSRGVVRGQFRGRRQIRGMVRGGQLRGQIRGGQIHRAAQERIPSRGFSPRSRGGQLRGQGRGGIRGRGTTARGQGRWLRGRGAARGRLQSAQMSKEDLDKQLDQYMSGTRAHLDEDLDSYMMETWA